MNTFEKYSQFIKDDNHTNEMDEKNIEVMNNDVPDSENDYESHFTPYENLFSDSSLDF